jgi:2-polyprenyl-3-methyl-5-hydroxy-6-metoxy-1,4-benzoquinol methylase
MNPKQYWENKLLAWERLRYSKWASAHPFAWSVRARFFKASQVIQERVSKGSSIFEIGCGSGLLAERLVSIAGQYKGIDIAENAIQLARQRINHQNFKFHAVDLLEAEFELADLTVLLGVVDWLDYQGVEKLFSKIRSKNILVSHTDASKWSPYLFYRRIIDGKDSKEKYGALNYSAEQIQKILKKNGYSFEAITEPNLLNPGALIWASKKVEEKEI